MNRIFKVIRNHTTRSCVVASEFAKSKNTISSSSGNTNAQTPSKRLLNLGALTITSALQATAVSTIVIGSFASTDANAAIAISSITRNVDGDFFDNSSANAEGKGDDKGNDSGTSPYNYYNPGSLSYSDSSSINQNKQNNHNMYHNNLSHGIAIGCHTDAVKNGFSNGIAIGDYANATGGLAIAFGISSQATDISAMALGTASRASGFNSLAMMRQSAATGNFSVAIGSVSYAKGNASFAMGASATAFGNQSIAIGSVNPTTSQATKAPVTTYDAMNRTQTNGDRSMALGSAAKTSGDDSFAIGSNAETGTFITQSRNIPGTKNNDPDTKDLKETIVSTKAAKAIAFGNNAKARKDEAIAFGTNATAHSNASIAFGNKANVTGNISIAFGNESTAIGDTSIAFGKKANATGKSAIAFGADANATGNFTLAVGDKANAKGDMSMAIGQAANTKGKSAIAFGSHANATAMNATAFGTNANATANFSIAFGDNAKASALNATAIGNLANASANFTLAMGTEAKASAINAAAFGHKADASHNFTLAMGTESKASAINATAIGYKANASVNHSVALGFNSTTTAGQDTNSATVNGLTYSGFAGNKTFSVVSVGSKGQERQIQHVAAGNISATSTDAINGSQLYLTQQTLGNVANSLNITLGGDSKVHPNGTVKITNIGNTGKNNIHEAIMAVNNSVAAGKNVKVDAKKDEKVGNITYTVNAWNTTVQGINDVNVTGVVDNTNYTLNYTVDLSKSAKENITLANTTAHNANATVNKGWNITTNKTGTGTVNGNTKHNVKMGTTITLIAGDNINITQDTANITIATSKTPTFTNITVGTNTTIDNHGLKIKNGPSITLNGINAGDKKITNVSNGSLSADSKDAVNGSQLYATNQNVTKNANNIANNTATIEKGFGLQAQDGQNVTKKLGEKVEVVGGNSNINTTVADGKIKINLNNTLNLTKAGSITIGNTTLNNDGLKITNGPSITYQGINAGNRVITNVAAGVNGTDAVNVDQLKKASASAKTELENGTTTLVSSRPGKDGQTIYRVEVNKAPITVNNDGIANTEAGDVNNSFATVGDVVNALNNVSWIIQGNGETKDQVTAGNKVNFINGNGTTAVVNTNAEGTVTNVSFDVNTSSMAFNSTSGKIDVGDSNGFATAGDVAKAIKDAELTSTVVAGSNLKVSSTVNGNNTEFKVSLANNLDLTDQGSVKIGDTTLNKDGLKVGDTSVSKDGVKVGDINITKDGINAGGKKITNLANGTEATDAVNLSQLKASTAAAKTELTNGTTTTVNSVQGKDGQTIYSVEVNKAPVTVNSTTGIAETSANPAAANNSFATVTDVVNALNNISWSVNSTAIAGTNGVSSYQQTSDSKISAGDSVNYKAGQNIVLSGSGNNLVIATNPDSTFDSVTAKNQVTVGSVNIASSGKISGVADGDISPISTEAVNGSQLYATHQNIADYLGGNASLDANGALQAPTYTINKTDGTTVTAHNVGDALGHLNNEVIKPLTFAGDIGTPSERPLGSTIALTGGVTEESQLSDNNIGVTSDGKGTINVKLAKDIKVNSVNANTVTVGDTKIDSDGISIHNGPSVTKSGINAAGNKITNVKAGEADTDAVNVSQLKGVANNINNRINAVNNKVDRIDQNLRAGVASAIASGSLYHVTLPGKSMLAAGVGTYKGQSAIAVGYSRLSDNGKIGVKVSVNSNTRGDTGAGASIGYQW
ncbi:YadA-like family protein [Actinobacillus equuli]|uniref:YadA-like family protein n=1 Tax=Actinobacillus equuli TaxID=718 RepID=UPI00244272FE|nr:YadA-like family protein [Actinobacillus equuli]WGE41513.1 YadA-like family protein [Actinobacillus equuli subsp. haemolyticus]